MLNVIRKNKNNNSYQLYARFRPNKPVFFTVSTVFIHKTHFGFENLYEVLNSHKKINLKLLYIR